MNICTIDVGKGGGFAWTSRDVLGDKVEVVKMPDTTSGILRLIRSIDKPIFVLESVNIRPQDFEDGSIYRKVDVMIRNTHIIEALLEVENREFIKVSPRKWQSRYRNKMKGLEYTERKRFLKTVAADIFRNINVTLWSADALLMLNFFFGELQSRSEWLRDKNKTLKTKIE